MDNNEELEKQSSDLLDCYRIALDFGMPAALRAYKKLNPDSTLETADTDIPVVE